MRRSSQSLRNTPAAAPSLLPRMGFLLFMVAVAIVALPRIRGFRQSAEDVVAQAQEESESPKSDLEKAQDTKPTTESKSEGDSSRPQPFADDPVFREQLSIVVDKTLELKPYEMSVYWRLLREANNASFDELSKSSHESKSMSDFFLHPAEHRGELLRFSLIVREVRRYDAGKDEAGNPKSIYEVWGSGERTPKWLYVLITSELPPNTTEASLARKRADFVGYFMKLQAYHPASSKPSDHPMLSPLFLGRIQPGSAAVATEPTSWKQDTFVFGGSFLGIVGIGAIYFLLRGRLIRKEKIGKKSSDVTDEDLAWLRDDDGSAKET